MLVVSRFDTFSTDFNTELEIFPSHLTRYLIRIFPSEKNISFPVSLFADLFTRKNVPVSIFFKSLIIYTIEFRQFKTRSIGSENAKESLQLIGSRN